LKDSFCVMFGFIYNIKIHVEISTLHVTTLLERLH
jgi:hypothetical protein